MVLKNNADRCTVAENFSYGLIRERLGIEFGKKLSPVPADALQEKRQDLKAPGT